MNPTRTLLIIARARHVSITRASINDEQDLSRDLRTQKARLIIANLLPLRKVLRYLSKLDTSRSLPVTRMLVMRRSRVVWYLWSRLEMLVMCCCRREQQRVHAAVVRWLLAWRLR